MLLLEPPISYFWMLMDLGFWRLNISFFCKKKIATYSSFCFHFWNKSSPHPTPNSTQLCQPHQSLKLSSGKFTCKFRIHVSSFLTCFVEAQSVKEKDKFNNISLVRVSKQIFLECSRQIKFFLAAVLTYGVLAPVEGLIQTILLMPASHELRRCSPLQLVYTNYYCYQGFLLLISTEVKTKMVSNFVYVI